MLRKLSGIFVIVVVYTFNVYGQHISKDSIQSILKATPSLSVYKENYIITGTSTDTKASKENSDVKFQISFQQRLANVVFPFKTYLFISYTQRSIWNVYMHSSPFAETNFNPGIGFGKYIFSEKKPAGMLNVMLEHESNGMAGQESRSWNYLSVAYLMYLSLNKTLLLKGCIPFLYTSNPELLHYVGYGEATFTWAFLKNKFLMNAMIRKGNAWDIKGNIQLGLYYKPFKSLNEYMYLQFFNGYAESLEYYFLYRNEIRLGISIRPSLNIF
ncbi:MAG: phospholipase A [Cytophagales bacterium]|nr:phospholipase A [Cytophaga sp.]